MYNVLNIKLMLIHSIHKLVYQHQHQHQSILFLKSDIKNFNGYIR